MELAGVSLILFLIAYFLPAIIAAAKNRSNTLAITILNLLLGWTLIGWVVALVWSVKNESQKTVILDSNGEVKQVAGSLKEKSRLRPIEKVIILVLVIGVFAFMASLSDASVL